MLDALVTVEAATRNDFFTWESLGTLTGATGATIVVGQVARRILRRDVVWIPFLVALVVCGAAAGTAHKLSSVSDILLVFLNGCLVFATALGANDTAGAAFEPSAERGVRRHGRGPVGWRWLR